MAVARAVCCAAVLVWAVTLSIIDIRYRRLPNALTLTGAAVIVGAATACGRGAPALLGALALGGVYLLVHLAGPSGLGGGDVKLAVALGALTGAVGSPVWVLAALGAPILTVITGTVSLVRHRSSVVPHGPSMCAASVIAAALAVF